MEENSESHPQVEVNTTTPAIESNTSTPAEEAVPNFNEKGEIVGSSEVSNEMSDREKEITQTVQDLADESETGLDPNNFSGDLKEAVKKGVEESRVAAKGREKLREQLGEEASELPPINIRNE
jgi:hypothetical protein